MDPDRAAHVGVRTGDWATSAHVRRAGFTLSHPRFVSAIASLALLACVLTACAAGGNAPVADQPGTSAQTASFVPQSAGLTSSRADALDAMAEPLPEPRLNLSLGGARPLLTAPIINDSGSYTNGAIIVGADTANGYGVEGITDGSGAGLYGHSGSSSATSYGVYGFSPGAAGVYGYDTKSGSGVLGASANGNGVKGETSFPSSGKGTFQEAGVLGEDLSTDSGYQDAGVAGIATNGNGVYGSSTNNNGVYGYSYDGSGLYGVTQIGYAVTAESVGTGGGLYADGGSGEAIIAQSDGLSLLTENGSSTATMSLDASGNMILLGNLTVDGTVTQGSTTKPAISSPGRGGQVESVGDGSLAGGSAYVTIDPDFAKQLDPSKSYHVFLTPDGDSKGLYVSGKTATGFTVRENQGGRSTLPFDYRIVGTPREASLPHPVAIRSAISSLRLPRGPGGLGSRPSP